MSLPELSRIDKSIEIQAPPERVWRALTDARELGDWFRVAIEGAIAPGAEVWMTSLMPSHQGMRFAVRIVEMTAARRLVWQWHPGEIDRAVDYTHEPMTTVTFTLEPAGTGTRLTVSETGFDAIALARRAKVFRDNDTGWAEVTRWLKAHAEATR